MVTHKLFVRKFRGEIPKNGGMTPRRTDEIMSLEREGDTFRISRTQVLLVPHFVADSTKPQWGFWLDDSTDVQVSLPILVQVIMTDQDNHLSFDRELIESRIQDEIHSKFPKTFR
jgi:hypothetical protein